MISILLIFLLLNTYLHSFVWYGVRLSFRVLSKDKVNDRAFAFFAGRPDFAFVIFYDLLHNGQADAAAAVEVEAKKTAGKAKRTVKKTEAKVEEAATKPARKARAAKLDIVIQSVMGGAITPGEIAAKVPKGADTVFVRVDQNKLWWIRGEETGNVDIWE